MTPSFTYAARVERVVDADTLDVAIDLGFRIEFRVRLRIAHVDAPELSTEPGKAARSFVQDLLCLDAVHHEQQDHRPSQCVYRTVTVTTQKPDKYGRALADVFWPRDDRVATLAEELLAAGHARPYEGGRR